MRSSLLYLLATGALIVVVAWGTQIYDTSLRNAQFFDGIILLIAMILQMLLHVIRKQILRLPGSESSWSDFHIYTGYFVIVVFAMHTSMSLPDTSFEWMLWILFVLVAVSGLFGTYLTGAIPHRLEEHGKRLMLEQIPTLTSELAQRVASLALRSRSSPDGAAITDVYMRVLHDFFKGPKNMWLHLRSSRRPMKRLMFELESVEGDIDQGSHRVLHEIKGLVARKNRLDIQYAYERALKLWLFVHIPATYGLLVLSILHVLSIYAFRSGVE